VRLSATGHASDKALTVFVPVRPYNPLNTRLHWGARARRAKQQRDAVSLAVWGVLRGQAPRWYVLAPATSSKAIELTAHVGRLMDDDGLSAALKSYRDGLQDCGLIHDDGPTSGHVFTCRQQAGKPYGVTITVACR
jgi:hypothetical protein